MNIIFRKDKGFASGDNLLTGDAILEVYQLDHEHIEGETISGNMWQEATKNEALVRLEFNSASSASSVRSLIRNLEHVERGLILNGKN